MLVEAQIRTAEDFDFDYVSCISDPAREAADCGAAVRFFDDQPPAIDEAQRAAGRQGDAGARCSCPTRSAAAGCTTGCERRSCSRSASAATKLVEGWVEGPCAEAADLRGINTLMLDFYDDPDFVRDLFDFVVEMELRFARAQVERAPT